MTKYFIHDGEKQTGPFTLIELTSQNITPQTPIWHRGLDNWTKARDLDELQPLLAAKKSPPPFQTGKSGFPPFTRARANRPGGIPVGYLIAAVILIAGLLFWYFSPSPAESNLPVVPGKPEQVSSADSSQQYKEQAEKQRIKAQMELKKVNYRNNWTKYVRVLNDDYKTGFLGGIYNLEIELVNDTEYILDEVVVLVRYIKEKGAVYKAEPVVFYNVPAHGKAAMPAPDSNRGTSVEMEINAISSKRLNFCYSSDIDPRGSYDPYRCKMK